MEKLYRKSEFLFEPCNPPFKSKKVFASKVSWYAAGSKFHDDDWRSILTMSPSGHYSLNFNSIIELKKLVLLPLGKYICMKILIYDTKVK